MSVSATLAEIEALRTRFLMLPEPPTVVDYWLDIVVTHGLKGKRIHDAHLAATMKANGVTGLLTFNVADFPPDSAITVVCPAQ